jgi:Haemolymph juvenile hormone binding protein (JHBP)
VPVYCRFSPESGPAAWQCSTPYLSLIGKYEASGRVLILPIAGKGDLNITMGNSSSF